ncbi:unnamed protein product [Trichogramma brassicae]|uniref:Uncharacterized protein n=1 Tax=Trichogramma brassicae TaxID=86971 RepID=A0A6H5IA98_9HYME|nr:unnamed protein product [Trichogramma brassicae]
MKNHGECVADKVDYASRLKRAKHVEYNDVDLNGIWDSFPTSLSLYTFQMFVSPLPSVGSELFHGLRNCTSDALSYCIRYDENGPQREYFADLTNSSPSSLPSVIDKFFIHEATAALIIPNASTRHLHLWSGWLARKGMTRRRSDCGGTPHGASAWIPENVQSSEYSDEYKRAYILDGGGGGRSCSCSLVLLCLSCARALVCVCLLARSSKHRIQTRMIRYARRGLRIPICADVSASPRRRSYRGGGGLLRVIPCIYATLTLVRILVPRARLCEALSIGSSSARRYSRRRVSSGFPLPRVHYELLTIFYLRLAQSAHLHFCTRPVRRRFVSATCAHAKPSRLSRQRCRSLVAHIGLDRRERLVRSLENVKNEKLEDE